MVARDPPASGKGPVPWTRRRSTTSDLEVYLQSVGSGWGLSEASRGVQGCQERECGRRLSQDEGRTPSADSQQQTWSGSLANTRAQRIAADTGGQGPPPGLGPPCSRSAERSRPGEGGGKARKAIQGEGADTERRN